MTLVAVEPLALVRALVAHVLVLDRHSTIWCDTLLNPDGGDLVVRGSVNEWLRWYDTAGTEALRPRKAPGAAPGLTPAQARRVRRIDRRRHDRRRHDAGAIVGGTVVGGTVAGGTVAGGTIVGGTTPARSSAARSPAAGSPAAGSSATGSSAAGPSAAGSSAAGSLIMAPRWPASALGSVVGDVRLEGCASTHSRT